VDSAAGQCASPLIGERPVSLPIPTREPSPTSYGQLSVDLRALAHDLSAGRLSGVRPCHLDPDIDAAAIDVRPAGWRGALGQVSSALSHLRNQCVGAGDLFLFWGLYRPVERFNAVWRYCGPRQHALFGWLHVEAVCVIDDDGTSALHRYPWLRDHPHVRPGWGSSSNAVYVASESFTLAGRRFAGSGTFQRTFQLTEPGSRLPSTWAVPEWLDASAGGVGMTYHPPDRWLGQGRVKSAARGQEFVADITGRDDAERWVADMLEAHR
jgi:hypothetical protein